MNNLSTKFKTLIGLSLLTVMLGGCAKTEYSAELTEPAEIMEVVYTPSQHGSGTGMGMSMKGTMVMTVNNVNIPEVFAVVFKCEHGKFIIQRRDIWEKAKIGMKVTVHYREVYRVTDKARSLVKYDFIDFTP